MSECAPTPTILVVDDDERLAHVVVIRLEREGWNCMVANTGRQALSILEAHQPDLVISDLNMPDGDGLNFIHSVRRLSQIPIIVVSGFTDAYTEELSVYPEITRVQKPFDTTQLIELVETELSLSGAL